MKKGNLHIDSVKITNEAGKEIPMPEKKCECGNKATFFVTSVDAFGKTAKKAYCLLDAIKEGLLHPKAYDLLGGNNTLHRPAVKSCHCGCTLDQIQDRGLVGCPSCYKTFSNELGSHIRKVQPGQIHDGKAPRGSEAIVSVRRRIRQLQKSMSEAIRCESYEQAAQTRDQIKQLEATL